MGASLFARTGPAGQALSPLSPEGKGDLGESGGAPLQGKRGRGSFRKKNFPKNPTSYAFLQKKPSFRNRNFVASNTRNYIASNTRNSVA